MSTVDVTRIEKIDQDTFLDLHFSVRPGEHVSLLGETGSGKTSLGLALMKRAMLQAPARHRGVVLAMKPHKKGKKTGDETVKAYSRVHEAKIIRHWPPPVRLPGTKIPLYYVLWPVHTFDMERDDQDHYSEFRSAILGSYKRGDTTIFADEVASLVHELGLRRELETVWSKGRSMDTNLFAATQRPAGVPLVMYSQATHLFLWKSHDKRDRDRYREIGGFNPRLIEAVNFQLKPYECLYLNKANSTACVVKSSGRMPDMNPLPSTKG